MLKLLWQLQILLSLLSICSCHFEADPPQSELLSKPREIESWWRCQDALGQAKLEFAIDPDVVGEWIPLNWEPLLLGIVDRVSSSGVSLRIVSSEGVRSAKIKKVKEGEGYPVEIALLDGSWRRRLSIDDVGNKGGLSWELGLSRGALPGDQVWGAVTDELDLYTPTRRAMLRLEAAVEAWANSELQSLKAATEPLDDFEKQALIRSHERYILRRLSSLEQLVKKACQETERFTWSTDFARISKRSNLMRVERDRRLSREISSIEARVPKLRRGRWKSDAIQLKGLVTCAAAMSDVFPVEYSEGGREGMFNAGKVANPLLVAPANMGPNGRVDKIWLFSTVSSRVGRLASIQPGVGSGNEISLPEGVNAQVVYRRFGIRNITPAGRDLVQAQLVEVVDTSGNLVSGQSAAAGDSQGYTVSPIRFERFSDKGRRFPEFEAVSHEARDVGIGALQARWPGQVSLLLSYLDQSQTSPSYEALLWRAHSALFDVCDVPSEAKVAVDVTRARMQIQDRLTQVLTLAKEGS